MGAFDYFKMCVTKKYSDFTGRARRSEYWNFVLISILPVIIIYGLFAVSLALGSTTLSYIFMALYIICALALLVPSLAALVRRLHDTGRSGWWYFIGFVPIVGAIALLVFLVQDSQPGTNQWGPNPKAPDNADEILSNLV
ncbi:MAG: DUF805 domain-containing protein [Saprospiraceae bacterium]|nr:DUF805 domain-containing protein [Saprospiraceae bacterium]